MLYDIALNEINGIGPAHIQKLIAKFGSAEEVFKQNTKELMNYGLAYLCAKSISDCSTLSRAETHIKKAQDQNIDIITINDEKYPELLKEIYSPPSVLYVKGNINALKRNSALGVVGTRNPDSYGKKVTEIIVGELVGNKIDIISGMASGIDTIAHRECIRNGGITIAILGTGADIVYPDKNRDLSEEICDKGALISEFPPGTFPARYNFPKRNRIISGLSLGTLVIQAKSRSGSLITAHHALQQGREVFAIPGDIFNEKCDGTFRLIEEGAIPVRTAGNILSALSIQQNLFKKSCEISRVNTFPIDLLNSDEKVLYEIMTSTPQRIDELSDQLPKISSRIFSILLDLELKGLIKQVAGQQYVLF